MPMGSGARVGGTPPALPRRHAVSISFSTRPVTPAARRLRGRWCAPDPRGPVHPFPTRTILTISTRENGLTNKTKVTTEFTNPTVPRAATALPLAVDIGCAGVASGSMPMQPSVIFGKIGSEAIVIGSEAGSSVSRNITSTKIIALIVGTPLQ